MVNQEISRAQFEVGARRWPHYSSRTLARDRMNPEFYASPAIQAAWEGWKLAIASFSDMKPEDSRCPPTYRREEAVKVLIKMGWHWDGRQWNEPCDDGQCKACMDDVCTAKDGCVACSYEPGAAA